MILKHTRVGRNQRGRPETEPENNMAVNFPRNDAEYESWLHEHQTGFMANTWNPPSASYFRIHRATCTNMPDRAKPGNPNPKTARMYSKITADSREELEDYARTVLGLVAFDDSNYCKSCAP